MSRSSRYLVSLALGASLLVSACGPRPVGDFGRAAPSVVHDVMMPQAGLALAAQRREPVSSFNRSDEEELMADRIWRFMIAAQSGDWAYDSVAELQRTRITPLGSRAYRTDRYVTWLLRTHYQSSSVRYATLRRHIQADLDTLPATFQAICAVIELDRQRAAALYGLTTLGPQQALDVAARRAENEAVIARFAEVLDFRYRSYNLALDRLLVETPHVESVGVDAELARLSPWVARALAGEFCASASGPVIAGHTAIPSRYARWAENEIVEIK